MYKNELWIEILEIEWIENLEFRKNEVPINIFKV
jgi:hypothetical protein